MEEFRNERLHHTRKRVLARDDGWNYVDGDSLAFLEDVVDCARGFLSENKWKKLYAILANICKQSNLNYRVYLSIEGIYYDTTIHRTTDPQELAAEIRQQDVAEEINALTSDDRLRRLKRWKLELEQLNIKIEQMTQKREEFQARYDKERAAFVEEL